jgi:cytochrome c553
MAAKGRRAGRIARALGARLALQMALMIAVAGTAVCADDMERAGARSSGVRAKAEYCTDCHGLSGQGYVGYLVMPRLAGQQTEYLENQLRAFAEHTRQRNFLINMGRVHGLSPGMRAALAAHFRELNPRPFGHASRQLAGTGKKIYEDGLPEANVPACAACHGPDAKGKAAIPRLAGQLYAYTVKELSHWAEDRGQASAKDDTSAVMLPISHNLTKSQIEAIAAYLSGLD